MKNDELSSAKHIVAIHNLTRRHLAHSSDHLIKHASLVILLYRTRYKRVSRGKRIRKMLFVRYSSVSCGRISTVRIPSLRSRASGTLGAVASSSHVSSARIKTSECYVTHGSYTGKRMVRLSYSHKGPRSNRKRASSGLTRKRHNSRSTGGGSAGNKGTRAQGHKGERIDSEFIRSNPKLQATWPEGLPIFPQGKFMRISRSITLYMT